MTKRQRADWWGPEYVLDRLESGETILEITATAGRRMGRAPLTLYGDVRSWLKRDEDGFTTRYQAAMLSNTGRVPRGGAPATVLDEKTVKLFFKELERNGGRLGPAAETVGVKQGTIYAKRNPNGKDYDPEFARRVDELEGSRFGRIRENYLEAAELDPWLGERALITGLPHLHNPKHHVEISGRVEHHHQLSERALAQIEERQALWRGARPALPEATDESRVIVVESKPVEVEA